MISLMGIQMISHYGVATMSRLLQIIGLFCRIWSLLQGSFAKETYTFKEPPKRSHPIQYLYCYLMYILALMCMISLRGCDEKNVVQQMIPLGYFRKILGYEWIVCHIAVRVYGSYDVAIESFMLRRGFQTHAERKREIQRKKERRKEKKKDRKTHLYRCYC